MNAYVKTDTIEYMIYNVVNATYTNGCITIIWNDKGEIRTSQFSTESLDGGTVTII